MTTAYSIHKPASFKSHKPVSTYGSPLPPSPPHKRQNSHVASQLEVSASSLDSVRTDLSSNSRDVIVGDQWLVLAKIGEGSFGEVFEAQDVDTGRHCAIKREPLNISFPQLKHESIMYDVLAGGRGIPKCEWYGEHDEYTCIVIDLLGPSLKHLLDVVSYVPLDIIVDLSCQMVSILEHIHNRGLVYRDVKPENFLFPAQCALPDFDLHEQEDMENQGSSTPYYQLNKPTCQEVFEQWGEASPMLSVVDFGLATWWRNPTTGKPYPQSKKRIKHKTGTARYASLNVHRGKLHARRDDLESLGYLILDMTLGSLPWTGVHARNSKAGWDRMRELKEETDLHELCVGLPRGFLEFVQYARRLRFHDEPDYEHLRGLLRGSLAGGKYSELVKSRALSEGSSVKSTSSNIKQQLQLQPNNSVENGRRGGSGGSCPAQGNGRSYAPSKRRPSLKSPFQPKYSKHQQQQQQHHHHHHHNHHNHHYQQHQQQEGVFVMDDLVNELPAVENGNGKTSQHGNGRTANNQRRRGNSNSSRKANSGSRNRQDSSGSNKKHPQLGTPPSPPPNVSSTQQQNKPLWKTRKHHQKPSVGWNTHRHNQVHVVPGATWETAPPPPTLASWGENKAVTIWGHTGNPL